MQSLELKAGTNESEINVNLKDGFYVRFIKRFLDIILSSIAAIVLLPFHLMIVVLLKSTMPGPILFKQERVGLGGKKFSILKFRTMIIDSQAIKDYDSTKDQDRITKLGSVLRRTKLDETLQIYNILRGDMSIVGPRPTVMRAIIEHDINIRRLEVRPGLTGLAQINGNTYLTWDDRVIYDIEYIDTMTLWLDLKIIIKTLLVVVLGEERFTKIHI